MALVSTAIPAAWRANSRFALVLPAFAVLLMASAIFAPSSVAPGQLQSLLLFASVLGFAALGQHLVVTVGGLDLSVGAVVTLSALLFVKNANAVDAGTIAGAIAIALVAAGAVGLLNGLTVTVLRVTPLIATLGGGAIASGLAYTFQGQGAPPAVPTAISDFVSTKPLGIPVIAYLWVVAVVAVALFLRYVVAGRRFVLVGTNPMTARALGIRLDAYKVLAYLAAGVLFGIAGVLLGMVVAQPGLRVGESYLLPSIAAVVIGGTPLGGGLGSVCATAVGALFVVQLTNFTLALDGGPAIQQIVQGAVIVAAMALYGLRLDVAGVVDRLRSLRARPAEPPLPDPHQTP